MQKTKPNLRGGFTGRTGRAVGLTGGLTGGLAVGLTAETKSGVTISTNVGNKYEGL